MQNNLDSLLAQLQQWGMQSGAQKPSQYDLSNAYTQGSASSPNAGDSASASQGSPPQGAWANLTSLLTPKTAAAMSSPGDPSAQSSGMMGKIGTAFIPNTMKAISGKGGAG